jgi:hypothetical protein
MVPLLESVLLMIRSQMTLELGAVELSMIEQNLLSIQILNNGNKEKLSSRRRLVPIVPH